MLLSAKGLIKRYPQGDRTVEILHGIDLTLAPGEIMAILGPSGAGKSTLLHILGLMESATEGELELRDRPVSGLSPAERARCRNREIGFLFQFHHLLPELSAGENVSLPQRILGTSARQAESRAAALLQAVGLKTHIQQRPAQLSGGEQQRVALARALANDPALILADEPTGNLDRETGQVVLDLLWEQCRLRNAAVAIVTHQEDIATRADRWVRLRDGRIESEGRKP